MLVHHLEGPRIGLGGVLRMADGRRYTLHLALSNDQPTTCAVLDSAAIGLLPLVLRRGGVLRIEGSITREMFRNLVELSDAWHNWRPVRFRRLEIDARSVVDTPQRPFDTDGMFAWSGSLASTHTLVRHLDALIPGAARPRAVLRLYGSSEGERLSWQTPPELSAIPGQQALGEAGIATIVCATNARTDGMIDQEIGVMPIVAAALHAAIPLGGTGWHARQWSFAAQRRYPRPGPALPDVYGGGFVAIRADGGISSPVGMVREIARHPALLEAVSGCERRSRSAPPCGRCPPCTIAALAFACAHQNSDRRARFASVVRLPLRQAEIGAEAFALAVTRPRPTGVAHRLLRWRVAVGNVGRHGGEIARWIGAVTRVRPVWPR